MANTTDSNATNLSFAWETAPKTLPVTPKWKGLDPNSYSDFGGKVTTTARAPISVSRQKKKGTVTGYDCNVGFNMDLTKTNTLELLQAFFYADFREKMDTKPINGTEITFTGVTTSNDTYTASAATTLTNFMVGHLVLASNFGNALNNGVKTVTAVTGSTVVVAENLADEIPGSTARLEAVGYVCAAGDISMTATATLIQLVSVVLNFTTLGLNVGETIFLGDGTVGGSLALNAPGYARIKAIGVHTLEFDDTTFVPATDAGAGVSLKMFFGKVLKNEQTCSTILKKYLQFERHLGCDPVNDKFEYVTGCLANDWKLNCPEGNKLNMDMTFTGLDTEYLTSAKVGSRTLQPNEDAVNTASEVFRIKMSLLDGTLNPNPLFAYVSDFGISIKNNVSPTKAIGVRGAIDSSLGDFEVSGNMTAYFNSLSAMNAFKANSAVGLNAIFAKNNYGMVFDIPLITLANGIITVEKDKPITIPIDANAFQNINGYTMMTTWFSYLPNIAMPV